MADRGLAGRGLAGRGRGARGRGSTLGAAPIGAAHPRRGPSRGEPASVGPRHPVIVSAGA
ncbi:hypothetical protein ACFPM0_24485 [Pseudonocardia sulfidoxydans]|uniref:hypothetical protein n=1 Tax=Pseudonocardia sulfidoxydans TaxID=54011 RepID=UPI003610AC73